jgi:hypothetical protein
MILLSKLWLAATFGTDLHYLWHNKSEFLTL